MKSSKKIEIFNKSALVNLKAELARKQEEARQAKLKAKGETVIPTQIPKKLNEYSRLNHGVEERNQKDAEEIAEEEASCKKSRAALEEKAKLYEILSQGKPLGEVGDSEKESRYLVDFDQKASGDVSNSIDTEHRVHTVEDDEDREQFDSDDYGNPSDPEDDWVDYRDCLGRTRRCLRKDLRFLKEKDAKLADSLGMSDPVAEKGRPPEPGKVALADPSTSADTSEKKEPIQKNLELMSEDMKRQELRQKWEKQEEELREKMDVHYQDVLFDEVRTHGVGYYAFSRDEKLRQAEQEELQKLRVETEKGQTAASELRARRKEQMAARLKAARARKRAREGLPPEEEVDEQNEASGNVEDESLTMWPDCKAAEVAKAKEEEREKRRAKVEEAEEKRKRRLEKRPPPLRPWDVGKEGTSGTADPMSQEEWVKKKREERNWEFAPPAANDHRSENVSSHDDFTATDVGWNTSHLRASSRKTPATGGYSGNPSKWKKGNVTSKPETTSTDAPSTEAAERKRAEIPPPPTFDYYGPSSSRQNQAKPNPTSLDDAISAGLSYLRQQAEERDKQKEKGLLDII